MWHFVLGRSALAVQLVLIVSMLSAPVVAQSVTFRKIADDSTPIPGGSGTFTSFTSTPVIDHGNVAFEGQGSNPQTGIYSDIGGTLRPVATTNTVGLDGIGTFDSAFLPSISNGRVAFRGRVRLGNTFLTSGVYLESSGILTPVAETGMPAPGSGVFSFFGSSAFDRPSLDRNKVAFSALTSNGSFAVYLYEIGGSLSLIVNGNTMVPGRNVLFQGVGRPYLSGSNVVFIGSAPGSIGRGVYARIGGVIRVIADNTMMAPGGTTTFFGPGNPVIDGMDIVFTDLGAVLQGPDAQEGSYTYFDGVLSPGILEAPTGPGSPSLQDRAIVANRGPGIITTNYGGSNFRVIGTGDVMDGKTVSIAYQSHEAISGNEIVFFVIFDNGTKGIYVATIHGFCGNGMVDIGERCDDGNTQNGDGCSSSCQVEVGRIPTMSAWGLAVLVLLLCVGARLRFRRPWMNAK